MTTYAYYRLPDEDKAWLIEQDGQPEVLTDISEVGQTAGFVLAPFSADEHNPVLLIHPERRRPITLGDDAPPFIPLTLIPDDDREEHERYVTHFRRCHEKLADGTFQKVVLARQLHMTIASGTPIVPEHIFLHACRTHRHAFVAYVHTPEHGDWLTITPEVLIEGDGRQWHTMALAGTMRTESATPWSRKNRAEQQCVAEYIRSRIGRFASTITADGPRTIQAGALVHLRTDFHFTSEQDTTLGDMLTELHPTPAVCGLPKAETYDFITHNGLSERQYYSGFLGPAGIDGTTHLYVNLRCMRITGQDACLYAGGGLLAESREDEEWQETQAKMETIIHTLTQKTDRHVLQ